MEMIERDGKMFITTKPTITYLGPKDKVFTPAETKKMMMPKVDKELMVKSEMVDYDRLANKLSDKLADKLTEAVRKGSKDVSINIDKEFISESVANGIAKNNYWDRHYSSDAFYRK